ncbi:hypothetical protein BT63DRAFT_136680 [Microthyrium microscopicum]|uniref:Uncharacterized protein n=1 Tax=Microthyrium microscopicum TaxID=703497 RepID=A0A6A6UMY1_9PEZI|nr:hypothetical protein BT63DRAFT_136680 [Microthyrium microscopicum]
MLVRVGPRFFPAGLQLMMSPLKLCEVVCLLKRQASTVRNCARGPLANRKGRPNRDVQEARVDINWYFPSTGRCCHGTDGSIADPKQRDYDAGALGKTVQLISRGTVGSDPRAAAVITQTSVQVSPGRVQCFCFAKKRCNANSKSMQVLTSPQRWFRTRERSPR